MSRSRHPHERGSKLAYRRWRRRNVESKGMRIRDRRRDYDIAAGVNEFYDHITSPYGRRFCYWSELAWRTMQADADMTYHRRRRRSYKFAGKLYRRVRRMCDGSLWGSIDGGRWRLLRWGETTKTFFSGVVGFFNATPGGTVFM